MAAPPSPRPPMAQSSGGDAPLSVFLETDLGTRLALLVAPDTTIRRLKSQVAAEHAAAFPDIGPVAVKSFQVCCKGALYHLSESMTVTSAFPGVKSRYFLHVKMGEAAVDMRCCQGTPKFDGRETSEGHVGMHVEKHFRQMQLPAATPEVANDGLTHALRGGDATAVLNYVHAQDAVSDGILLLTSSQLDTETKNEAQGLASDADIDESLKKTKISHVVEADAKDDFLLRNQDCNIDGAVSDDKQKQIKIEDILGQGHAVDDIYQGKKRKKAKRADFVHASAADPGVTNEYDNMDINKSIGAPLVTIPTHCENSNTSFGQEVNDIIPEDSLRIETQSTVGKKKKRKRRQLAPSEAVSGQETTKLPTGAVGLSESGVDAYEVDLTNRDGIKARSSVLPLSSKPYNESQGGKHVEFVNNAQAFTDVTSEQGNFDHVHNGDSNPSIGDAINSTSEFPASGEKIAEGSNGPWDGGEKHEETKQHKYNEGSHDGDVAETSNMEKDGKNIDALEESPTANNISKKKKRKKVKKVNSVDMASMDTAGDKEILGHTENAGISDKVYAEMNIFHAPSVGHISDNVQQGDSNVTENPNHDGKRRRKKRRQSESLNDADPNQDLIKSAEHVANGSLIHHTNSAPLDAKQTTQGSVEGATASGYNKFCESRDIAAANMIDEVLADLKSRDSLSKELSEDLVAGQIHLDSNMNALEFPASIGKNVGDYAALPSKYLEAIHSDAPARSPSHNNPKGNQLNRLPAMIDSSHHSFGMIEEDADTKLKKSDTSRFSGKTSDLKDVFTGDVVEQDDDKTKSTKRQRKKVKKVPTDKTTQYLDEQVNQVAREDMVGANASIQADLVQGGSVIDTPMETVAKVQQKGKRASKSRAPKVLQLNHSTHAAKESLDENAIGITGTHDNENASRYPTESPVVQEDSATLKSSSPNARKERKKALKTELQSLDSAMEHDPSADLVRCGAEKDFVSPKNSSDTAEANRCIVAHPASDKINSIDNFSLGKVNDQLVSAQNLQNNEDEIMEAKNKKNNTGSTEPNDVLESLPAEKTSLTNHFDSSEVVIPSAKAENVNREYDNAKSGREKRKKKRKPNPEGPAADKENLGGDHQGTVIGTQNSLHSAEQNGRMGQDNGNENNNKVTQDVSIMQQEPEDAAIGRTVDKKLHRCDINSQNNLPSNKVSAKISKESRNSTTQKKAPVTVSNLVKSFDMSPAASSDSAMGTPQIANRFRVTVRKVTKKKYEQANAKSKKEIRDLGSGAISGESEYAMDTKGEKATVETSSENSSSSANSGISSTAYDESDAPDDDGAYSLSQKSLRGGLQIGSILRGSNSYKKAKQKQAELLDDDTEVPDSQPPDDDLWGP